MRKPREEKFVTIKDVAKESGVSIATVSRVMNNGRVKDEKKQKVLSAIKKLNYVPNNSARNLAAVNATKRIKLLVPTIALPCYSDLIKGFKKGANLYKYDPIIEDYEYDFLKYQDINMLSLATSEIKGIVQIGPYQEIANKIVISLDDELLNVIPSEKYCNQKIGVYFPGDEYLTDFFMDNVFKNEKTTDITKDKKSLMDFYLTQTIEQAAQLMNQGILKPIYTLETSTEIEKLVSNIHHLPVDFFAIGLTLSRIAIKKITATLSTGDQSLEIVIQ